MRDYSTDKRLQQCETLATRKYLFYQQQEATAATRGYSKQQETTTVSTKRLHQCDKITAEQQETTAT